MSTIHMTSTKGVKPTFTPLCSSAPEQHLERGPSLREEGSVYKCFYEEARKIKHQKAKKKKKKKE